MTTTDCAVCHCKLGGPFDTPESDVMAGVCVDCVNDNRKRALAASGGLRAVNPEAKGRRPATLPMRVTTGTTFSDMEIAYEIDVVTSECAYGMNIFKDFASSVTDFIGGRSMATQKVLSDAGRHCMQGLRNSAKDIGGDAIIGVDLDYSELSGGGKSMLFLVASGTAVKLKEPH